MAKINRMISNSIGGVDGVKNIDIKIENNAHLFAKNKISEKMDLLEEYNLERDGCRNYRIMMNIRPFCSNILFNSETEILTEEGTDNCRCLNFSPFKYVPSPNNISRENYVDAYTAIRNTEYSHPELGKFIYHCGLDIMNNHRLRSKDFVHVNNVNYDAGNSTNINTIDDYLRDSFGNVVYRDVPVENGEIITNSKPIHLYGFDSIMNFNDVYKDRVKNVDSWWGFSNITTIDIPIKKISKGKEETEFFVNRVMNNNKPCEMIDFYPDRSLYSFNPIYNRARQREERNWDYCLTYPYKSDKETLNKVMGNDIGALKIISSKLIQASSGNILIQFKTLINHNLKDGSFIKIWYFDNKSKEEIISIPFTFTVRNVGNIENKKEDKEHYFSISFTEMKNFIKPRIILENGEFIEDFSHCLDFKYVFKRVDSRSLCDYYFRVFKKIDTDSSAINSVIGRASFSENIFGDKNSQIIFTDSINTSGLIDNRGREVTSLYLTIIKRNAGRKEWYEEHNTGSDKVEASHCFGKVTSGLELVKSDDAYDYNIHRMHNVMYNEINPNFGDAQLKKYKSGIIGYFKNVSNNRPKPPQVLEDDITIQSENGLYLGDIVEYDPFMDTETVIEKVYHRFNTAQREDYKNEQFFHFYFDNIISDDYDMTNGGSEGKFFKTEKKDLSIETEKFSMPANIFPEGYYYCPHYEIKLNELSRVPNREPGTVINVDFSKIEKKEIGYYDKDIKSGHYVMSIGGENSGLFLMKISVPKKVQLAYDDFILLYDKKREKDYYGKVVDILGCEDIKISFKMGSPGEEEAFRTMVCDEKRYNMILIPAGVPEYASFLNNTNQNFVWRGISKYSELTSDDELYDVVYTNGCIYIENSINFFLRRQDPFQEYGLSWVEGIIRVMNDTIPEGEEFDLSSIDYIPETNNVTCG